MTMIAEYCKVTVCVPDPSYATFVSKIQKVKTRKGKEYFIMRTTIPKEITGKIKAEAGDYLFFKTKKAEWFHMMDWDAMKNTWNMLPADIRKTIMTDGLYGQGISNQSMQTIGAANVASSNFPPMLENSLRNAGENHGNSL